MNTQLIALDAYGTILCSDDYDNSLPTRKGFANSFIPKCKELGLPIVTISDAPLEILVIDINEALKRDNLDANIFHNFFRLNIYPKDVSVILEMYRLKPKQLFVIGNDYKRDIVGAESLGCQTLLVPTYEDKEERFTFSDIVIP